MSVNIATAGKPSVDFNDDEIIERVAGMVVAGITQDAIGKVFGVSQERISQFLSMPTFVAIIDAKREELGLQYKANNDLIDTVETIAWQKVKNTLTDRVRVDPDFALRAAMVANKANRRGITGANLPLTAVDGGRVVINLKNTYVDKLVQVTQNGAEEFKQITSESPRLLPHGDDTKVIDIANPAMVEKLLGLGDDRDMFGLGGIDRLDGSIIKAE